MSDIVVNIVLPIILAIVAFLGGKSYGKTTEKKNAAESKNEALKKYEEIDTGNDVDDPAGDL